MKVRKGVAGPMLALGIATAFMPLIATAEYKSPDVIRAENQLKMVLALNHQPCAEVTYVGKLEGSIYSVTCIKRVGRPARAHYAISATNMAVVSVR